jgi:hypothetical protein
MVISQLNLTAYLPWRVRKSAPKATSCAYSGIILKKRSSFSPRKRSVDSRQSTVDRTDDGPFHALNLASLI